MIQYPIPGHAAVAVSMRPREAGAGGGQRLETDTLQIAGSAHIPRIRDDETAALVQTMKCTAFIGDAGTNMRHEKSPEGRAENRLLPQVSIDSRAIQDNQDDIQIRAPRCTLSLAFGRTGVWRTA